MPSIRFTPSRSALIAAALALTTLSAASVAHAASQSILVSRDQDGNLVLSDRTQAGTELIERRTFNLPKPPSAATLRARQQYWAAQNDAFHRRHAVRQENQARVEAAEASRPAVINDPQAAAAEPVYGFGPTQAATERQITGAYRGAPGAVDGRQAPFIGSGFSSAR